MILHENNTYDQAGRTYDMLLQEILEIKNNYSIDAADYVLNTYFLDGSVSKGVKDSLSQDIRDTSSKKKFSNQDPIEDLITKDDILQRIKDSDWGAFLKESMDLDVIDDNYVNYANKFADKLIGQLKLEEEDLDLDEYINEDLDPLEYDAIRIFIEYNDELSDEDYFGIPGVDY